MSTRRTLFQHLCLSTRLRQACGRVIDTQQWHGYKCTLPPEISEMAIDVELVAEFITSVVTYAADRCRFEVLASRPWTIMFYIFLAT